MNHQLLHKEQPDIKVLNVTSRRKAEVTLSSETDGLYIFSFSFSQEESISPDPITLKWKIPHIDAKGVWKSDSIHDKRQQYDWELDHLRSRISVNAPVVNVFGTQDRNIITFACMDAINLIEMNALLREEDNH